MIHPRATLPTPTSTASFWHSEPNEFLLGHQTTNELPASADIVIVGSGITGAAVARYLAEDERARGKTMVMLEAREACWGATGRVRPILISTLIALFPWGRSGDVGGENFPFLFTLFSFLVRLHIWI